VPDNCKERIRVELAERVSDMRKLWKLYHKDPDASDPDLGTFTEYGLGFDYVAPGTFRDQKRGYFRYQLSWGGPQDEFRFYTDGNLTPVKIEYWFLDWFDGAKVTLQGRNYALLAEIFDWFKDVGAIHEQFEKARKRERASRTATSNHYSKVGKHPPVRTGNYGR